MKKILLTCLCLLFVGCGHTVYTSTKGIGIDISWATDTFVPSFRGGEYNVQNLVARGNSSMSMSTSTGGILGTGGTCQTTAVSTGIQFNEGNIVKVFQNPKVPDDAKTQLAKNLPAIIQPPKDPAEVSSRTTYAAGATGPNAVFVKTQSTGTDKIVDKIADNAETIKDVANTAIDTTGEVTKASFLATILATKWVLILAVLAISIVVIFIIILLIHIIQFIISYFKSRKVTAATLAGNIVVTSQKVEQNTFLSKKN